MPPLLREEQTTSPLSAISSPTSFVTATASPSNLADATTATDVDSPGDAEAESPYLKARQLPPELRQHCQIYLEENLHKITLSLLKSQLCVGGAVTNSNRGAYCPPPNQLAVLNTIVIHPDFTTRAQDPCWNEVASDSLVYLRNLLQTVGPINGRFKDAFHFVSRWSRHETPSSDSGRELIEDTQGETQLNGKYAKESVWRRGQEFFNVVGWAFNCSVLYPNRWAYWKQWLEFMCDVLETDLHERHRLDVEAHRRDGVFEGKCKFLQLEDSILNSYMMQRTGRSGRLKWFIKAIFADGGQSSNSLFQEVWHKEHKGKSRNTAMNKRKREKVNIEKGQYGAWLDDDSIYSSQASEPPTPQKKGSGSLKYDMQTLSPPFVESIALRQRLFALISYLCNYLPRPPVALPDLYEHYAVALKAQPLPIFTAFISSTACTSSLLASSQVSILQNLLEDFMPTTAVPPFKVDAERYDLNGTSPAILERCFLPNAASTIAPDDNAKVSLLLEELLQLIWMIGAEKFSDGLRSIVRKGVDAREAKARRKYATGSGRSGRGRGGNGDDADVEARSVLSWSGKRLRLLSDLITFQTSNLSEDADSEMMDQDEEEVTFMSARSS
ncbi:uncharacterized protein BCR38DRAFT_66921 [Pseudomassariella vexata]|uniref:Uncharacterized protein n=1 Tax=Pseudomassariella vexata TaxID=1141098 RepID=A0A1Y2DJA1_9PEZI|nr:uncharacterized protein BCR38DRAFT_66921 [Pseudomassariella vexata]ORY59246.1 hypothetical protein BCR38DRAFT_66921 [Pseudomassariella vexata]